MIFRKIARNKMMSLLKIATMGIGIASSLIMFYIVINEFNTDSFYKDKKQIHQVFIDYKSPDWNFTGTSLVQPFTPALVNDFSEIESGTITFRNGKVNFNIDNKTIEASTIYADSMYFNVFDRVVLEKESNEILSAINTAVVTKSFAEKCFGKDQSALSKIIKLNGARPLEIVAVIEDWPTNSSQNADIIMSFATLKDENRLYMGWGGGDSFQGYVKINKSSSAAEIEARIPDFVKKYVDVEKEESRGMFTKYMLIPITEASLKSNAEKKIILFILVFIGVLILGLVFFNSLLIKLSTYERFNKDISIRRTVGASAMDLQRMTFYESLFYVFATLVFATGFIWLMNPMVEEFYNFDFFDLLLNPQYLWIIGLLLFVIFLIYHIVPIIWIVRFFTKESRQINPLKHKRFQSILLTVQLGISLSLMIFLYFIHAQLSFISNFDKGYSSDNLLYIELNNEALYKNHLVLKEEIIKLKGVKSACLSGGVITQGLGGNGFYDNPESENLKIFRQLDVDYDFFATLGMELEGENFGKIVDHNTLIVNAEVGKIINTENPIGKFLYRDGGREIKAVVPNFVSGSLHSKMEPAVFVQYSEPSVYSILSIRIAPNNTVNTINEIKDAINNTVPNQLFQIKFYDNDIEKSYEVDRTIEKTISFFALLAILITISGLIGFSINMVNRRTKEIGIRKVNGATTISLLVYLNKRYIVNIAAALIVFIPLSYYLAKIWLQNYAYAVDISPWVFIFASLTLTILVLLIVSLATYRYANRNPVQTLRYE